MRALKDNLARKCQVEQKAAPTHHPQVDIPVDLVTVETGMEMGESLAQ
jgi:hypothetical protein